jgi:hypothetical protein
MAAGGYQSVQPGQNHRPGRWREAAGGLQGELLVAGFRSRMVVDASGALVLCDQGRSAGRAAGPQPSNPCRRVAAGSPWCA